jgi:hypothetical protein
MDPNLTVTPGSRRDMYTPRHVQHQRRACGCGVRIALETAVADVNLTAKAIHRAKLVWDRPASVHDDRTAPHDALQRKWRLTVGISHHRREVSLLAGHCVARGARSGPKRLRPPSRSRGSCAPLQHVQQISQSVFDGPGWKMPVCRQLLEKASIRPVARVGIDTDRPAEWCRPKMFA